MMKANNLFKFVVGVCSLLLISTVSNAQTPVIDALNKSFAPVDDTLTIRGSGFGADASIMHVQFGAAAANIVSISNTQLRVLVPGGTTFSSVSVTNTINGNTGYSSRLFFISFGGTSFNPSLLTGPTTFTAQSGNL